MGTRPVPSPRRVVPAALGLAAAAAAVVLLSGCTNAHPTDALSKLAHLSGGTLLASGETPPILEGVDSDLIPSSMRLLTEYQGTEFWVGVTRDDQVCFIADMPLAASAAKGSPTPASTPPATSSPTVETISSEEARCLDPDVFGIHGAYLTPGGGSQRFWLHTEYMTIPPQWTSISQNIALQD